MLGERRMTSCPVRLNGRPVANDIKASLRFMTSAPARPGMFTMLGAIILYAVTEWLWLVVHQGLR